MAEIHPLTATIATIYTNFWAFVVMSVYSFSADWKGSRTNVDSPADKLNYGIALLTLAVASLVTGLTSGDPDEPLFRAIFLCLTAAWASRGLYHVVDSNFNGNATEPVFTAGEGLFPGYGAFLCIFTVFTAVSLAQKSKHIAVLSFCLALSCVFEIVSFWEPLSTAAGSYYLLCSAICIYSLFRYIVKRKSADDVTVPDRLVGKEPLSVDYVVVGNAMNVVCSVVFASHVVGITVLPSHGFTWVVVPGIIQVICGVVSIRRRDAYHGCHFSLYGAFWASVGVTLATEFYRQAQTYPLIAVYVFFAVVFLCAGVFSTTKELFVCLQNTTLCIFCVAICTQGLRGRFIGGMGWVNFLLSLYGLAANLTRVLKLSTKLPLGRHWHRSERFKQTLMDNIRCCASCLYGQLQDQSNTTRKDKSEADIMLGYSKYTDLDMIGFFCNAVSGLAILWVPTGFNVLALPWVFGIGGVVQFLIGCVSFSRGKTFESCAFVVFGSLWLLWGTSRGLDFYEGEQCIAVAVGSIAFLAVGLLLLLMSAVISKAWFVTTFLFNMVTIAFLVDSLQVQATHSYEVVVMLVFAVVTLYCFLACTIRSIMGKEILPLGSPIFNVSYLHAHAGSAIWANARRDTGVTRIADILNDGGICGIPTDVVYILVAACKHPQAVERAYNTKKQAEERPMSMWISDLRQIEAGRELFGELTWAFMKEVWPSTISLVVNKGEWLQTLGIGEAEKYIGRPDSIAVRMPDNTITTHFIDKTGPVAVSSANPTGEADTTHHLQVLAKLGPKNCDGILCDGPSHENAASTVVDCRKINEGKLGFFRVGIVPKSKVQEIFEGVQRRFEQNGKSRTASVTSSSGSSADSGLDNQSQAASSRGSQKGSRKGSRKSSQRNTRRQSRKEQIPAQIEGTVNPAFIDDDFQATDSTVQTGPSEISASDSIAQAGDMLNQAPSTIFTSSAGNSANVSVIAGSRKIRRRDSASGESDIIDVIDFELQSSQEVITVTDQTSSTPHVQTDTHAQIQVQQEILNQEDATSSL